jgi:hypothetical protein
MAEDQEEKRRTLSKAEISGVKSKVTLGHKQLRTKP